LISRSVEAVDGDHVALEAEFLHAVVGRPADQVARHGPLDRDLHPGRLLRGLGAVPAVGGQHRPAVVGEHQQRAVGPGETRQIAHVDQVRDQHRVQPGGTDLRSQVHLTLEMCHDA
jgi:hypothetical protein